MIKDILPDKDPYHNRGRDQMRKKVVRNSSASACGLFCLFRLYFFSGNIYVKKERRQSVQKTVIKSAQLTGYVIV